MKRTKILVTGSNGQLGFELCRSLAVLGDVAAINRTSCDLANPKGIIALLDQVRPDIIVNAAAYTAVDRAEEELALAYAVNRDAPLAMADWAAAHEALLVHYSTDYVFDGMQDRPYREDDEANPLSVYGASKLAGEQAILGSGCRGLIFRTSWVFGSYGRNFLKTLLRLMHERRTLNVVTDQFGAPTASSLIADCTAQILGLYLRSLRADAFPYGVYNLTAGGETNWLGYAMKIYEFAALQGYTLLCDKSTILPILARDYPAAAKRPLNSRLDTLRLQQTFGLWLPAWQSGVEQVMRVLSPIHLEQKS